MSSNFIDNAQIAQSLAPPRSWAVTRIAGFPIGSHPGFTYETGPGEIIVTLELRDENGHALDFNEIDARAPEKLSCVITKHGNKTHLHNGNVTVHWKKDPVHVKLDIADAGTYELSLNGVMYNLSVKEELEKPMKAHMKDSKRSQLAGDGRSQ